MTNKPDLAALQVEAETSEKEWANANSDLIRARDLAKKTWARAAAAHTRYMRAKERMERTQMRARGVVEAESGNGS